MGKLLIKLEYRKLKKHYVSSLNKGSTKKKCQLRSSAYRRNRRSCLKDSHKPPRATQNPTASCPRGIQRKGYYRKFLTHVQDRRYGGLLQRKWSHCPQDRTFLRC